MFTNVFVKPASYDYYLANGKWPDKTIFVLEEYGSTSQGSINKHGSYQTGFLVFAGLAFVALLGLSSVKKRWRTTWGAASLSAARV